MTEFQGEFLNFSYFSPVSYTCPGLGVGRGEALLRQNALALPLNLAAIARDKYANPKAIALQKLRIDKLSDQKLDRRSRDVSHAFDFKARITQSQRNLFGNDRELGQDQSAIVCPESALHTTEYKRTASHSPRQIIEKHLISIYRNPEILSNLKLLEQEADKLHKSNISN